MFIIDRSSYRLAIESNAGSVFFWLLHVLSGLQPPGSRRQRTVSHGQGERDSSSVQDRPSFPSPAAFPAARAPRIACKASAPSRLGRAAGSRTRSCPPRLRSCRDGAQASNFGRRLRVEQPTRNVEEPFFSIRRCRSMMETTSERSGGPGYEGASSDRRRSLRLGARIEEARRRTPASRAGGHAGVPSCPSGVPAGHHGMATAEQRPRLSGWGRCSLQAKGAAGGAAAECDSWRPAAGWSVDRRDRVA